MYAWLDAALRDSSQVITANRRLARVLRAEHSRRMLAAGKTVWRSPAILSWHDWLSEQLADSSEPATLPIPVTAQQSRVLWERCLRREIADPLLNIGALARQAREAWNRLREWQVPLPECQRHARNRDQRLFAKAASNYHSILDRENWVDQAGLADLAVQEIRAGRCRLAGDLTLAGFDRLTPQLQSMVDAVRVTGRSVESVMPGSQAAKLSLCSAETSDTELRAAGVWARQQLLQSQDARIAIVVTDLEQDAQRSLRLIKEGLIPGWQNAGPRQNSVINISYGRKLLDYPAISVALLALRWLQSDLSTVEVSRLLQTTMLGSGTSDACVRVELRLRQQPDQLWSPKRLLGEISSWAGGAEGSDGVGRIRRIVARREQMPRRQSPATWVALFHEVLQELRWPGTESLHSAEFQLLNRWRELLNDVARLELVSPSMTAAEALGRINTIASETIYQPEADEAVVQVMGPLEAAGLQFDKLWVAGASGDKWPPSGRPLSLVSRDLQREAGMPDATPTDTLEYAERVIRRLGASASQVVFSFPRTQNDAPQSASELLQGLGAQGLLDVADPGWHARHLGKGASLSIQELDRVPPVTATESICGGAATIQRQFEEPFAAFAIGRLGVRTLWPIVVGLPAHIRGSLIHAALHRLYEECPSGEQIREWELAEIETRSEKAVQAAFSSHERNADAVLRQLLNLEKVRVKNLLRGVVALDAGRDNFRIHGVEQEVIANIAGLDIRVRIDRVDMQSDEQLLILDYKTGTPKQLLDRDKNPRDMQLVVYAYALGETVAGIALLNVDSRAIEMDGAGHQFTPDLDWNESLGVWKKQVEEAAKQIAAGDVRVNRQQTVQAARNFGLLSRYRELVHER